MNGFSILLTDINVNPWANGEITFFIKHFIHLDQACQTGGPFRCSVRPAVTFWNPYNRQNYNKVKLFTAVTTEKLLNKI